MQSFHIIVYIIIYNIIKQVGSFKAPLKNAYQLVALKDCILVLHFNFVSYWNSCVCITGIVKEQINPWLTDAVDIESNNYIIKVEIIIYNI